MVFKTTFSIAFYLFVHLLQPENFEIKTFPNNMSNVAKFVELISSKLTGKLGLPSMHTKSRKNRGCCFLLFSQLEKLEKGN